MVGCSGVCRVLTVKSVKWVLWRHVEVMGQCFELAAVQLGVYGIVEVVWKRIAFKREAFFRLVSTVQQSLKFCECRELLGRDRIQLGKGSEALPACGWPGKESSKVGTVREGERDWQQHCEGVMAMADKQRAWKGTQHQQKEAWTGTFPASGCEQVSACRASFQGNTKALCAKSAWWGASEVHTNQ